MSDDAQAGPGEPDPLLSVSGVVGGYRDVMILHGVDMHVEDGEVVTVVGPNGAGKSTLLKAIVGVVEVREGSVTFDGEDVTNVSPEDIVDHGLCYVSQSDNVFPELSVRENLRIAGWSLEEATYRERVEGVYEQFPVLDDDRGARAGRLSGGQRQMLAMGMGFLLEPDLLVLDEPSAGLAPSIIDDVFERIDEINDAGTAVLLVEQNARRALELSDRGYVVVQGTVEFEGTGREILDSDEMADLYLGSG